MGPTKKIFEIVTCRMAKKAFPRLKLCKILYCGSQKTLIIVYGKNRGREVSC